MIMLRCLNYWLNMLRDYYIIYKMLVAGVQQYMTELCCTLWTQAQSPQSTIDKISLPHDAIITVVNTTLLQNTKWSKFVYVLTEYE